MWPKGLSYVGATIPTYPWPTQGPLSLPLCLYWSLPGATSGIPSQRSPRNQPLVNVARAPIVYVGGALSSAARALDLACGRGTGHFRVWALSLGCSSVPPVLFCHQLCTHGKSLSQLCPARWGDHFSGFLSAELLQSPLGCQCGYSARPVTPPSR